MKDGAKSREQLIAELQGARERLAELEEWQTARRRAEDALRRSEERYRFLYEDSPCLNVIIGPDGSIKDVGRSGAKNLGYTKDEILGTNALDLIVPEESAGVAAVLEAAFRGEETPEMEVDVYGKDRSVHTVLFSAGQVLLFEKGVHTGVLFSGVDITQRKRTEKESKAIARLGVRLAAARTIESMITVVREETDNLFSWDAHYFAVRRPEEDTFHFVSLVDTVDGEKKAFQRADLPVFGLSRTVRNVLDGKLVLINRTPGEPTPVLTHFGNEERISASLMFVPVRSAQNVIGILSVQSYTYDRYSEADLQTLQRIADAVAPALERAFAAESLRESNEMLSSLVRSSPAAIVVLDKEARVRMWNPAAERIFGWTEQEVLGRLYPVIPEDKQAEFGKVYAENLAGIAHADLEQPCRRKGGSLVKVSVTSAPLHDSDGNVIGAMGILLDITGRRQAEQALRESERRYRLLAENATDLIWTMDMDLNLTYISPSVTRLRGYTVQEAMARRLDEVLAPASYRVVMNAVREELAAEGAGGADPGRWRTMELQHVCKDGSRVWSEAKMAFLRDARGQAVGVLGVTRDITERKRAEDKLKEYVRDLTILSQTAMGFVRLPSGADVYRYIGEQLLELEPNSIIIVNSYDAATDSVCLRAVLGVAESAKKLLKILGKAPVGMTLKLNDEARNALSAGNLHKVPGGLHELSFRRVPKLTCSALEKLFGVGEIYGMGFLKDGQLFGNTVIIMRKGAPLENPGVVATFVNQAAVALQRRQAEEALQAEKEKYRLLVEESPLAISIVDRDGNYKYVNPKFVEIFGYTLEDISTGRGWFEKAFPDENQRKEAVSAWLSDLKQSAPGEVRPRIFTVTCKDGFQKAIHFRPVTLESGDQFLTYEDITERKRAEEALRESEASYRELADSIADVFFAMDRNLRYTYWNRASEKLTGVSAQDAIGKSLYDVFPDVRGTKAEEAYRGVLQAKEPRTFLNEYSVQGKDFTFEISAYPSRRGMSVFVRDVSERKLAEEEKRRLQEQLAQAQKMQALGTLAGGIAHEYNNILAAIIGYVDLTLQSEELSEIARRNLDVVRNSASRAASLTKSLLIFSRKHVGEKKPVNLRDVVDEVLKVTAKEFTSEGIELVVKHSMRLPAVMGNASMLSSVIMNLVINARHAMFKSPVKKLTIQTGVEKTRPFIRVEDTGCGIPKDDLPRIFDPFFTTKGALPAGEVYDGKVHGTGLGLSVSHTIVEAHGGEIKVESHVGKGSVFTVYFPAASEVKPARRDLEGVRKEVVSRIMVVDDEEAITDLLVDILDHAGYSADGFTNPREAAEALRHEHYSLAFVDLQMPEMSGEEFMTAVNELPLERRPLKVILTGRLDVADEVFGRLDVFATLPKPFTAQQVLEVVERGFTKKSRSANHTGNHNTQQ